MVVQPQNFTIEAWSIFIVPKMKSSGFSLQFTLSGLHSYKEIVWENGTVETEA